MTELEKMISGKIYNSEDSELGVIRNKAQRLCKTYNDTFETEIEKRINIINDLIPNRGDDTLFKGPIHIDYGINLILGKNFFANYNFVCLDCAKVIIGDDVMIGPNCSLLTAIHPLRFQERNFNNDGKTSKTLFQVAKPIKIGNNCWIASDVTIIGGVTIGNGCVIGAGSVVTKDIPDNYLAVGNPCKPIKEISEKDSWM